MTSTNFISKLNWRQIVIHFVATWLFIRSFFMLARLHDLKDYEVLTKEWQTHSWDEARFVSVVNWLYTSSYVGLIVAFSISLAISIKRKWFWMNSVIILVLDYLFTRFTFDGWRFLKYIFLAPGYFFNLHTAIYYLSTGLPMLAIGLILFFSKYTNRLIENGNIKIENRPLTTT
jgi:hypothetical protein